MTDSRTWRVSAGRRTATGSATTAAAAWNNAATAALQLARDTGGAATLRLSVDGEGDPADVEPAHTDDGSLNVPATRALLAVLVDVVSTAQEV